jgi:hypothetical protein
LFEGMIDLLQVEATSSTLPPRGDEKDMSGNEETTKESTASSTSAPLKRAALHFILLDIRARSARLTNSVDTVSSRGSSLKRASTTLHYVASVDEDKLVRVMAREALEGLGQMEETILGYN